MKEWYDKEENMGKLMYCKELDELSIFKEKKQNMIFRDDGEYYLIGDVEPATPEQVEKFMMESK